MNTQKNTHKKLNILFIHRSFTAQFRTLHDYLNESGLANSYFLCSDGHQKKYQDESKNLVSFNPHKDISKNSYYYSGKAEKSAKISLGALKEAKKIISNHNIDLIMAHGTIGSPHLFFDEVNIPIISYIEFPSYRHHGWDPQYPPMDCQRYSDKNFEMLSYYQALKSDLVITPSEYARNMFPKELRSNIVAQMEGFNPEGLNTVGGKAKFKKEKGKTYIGFAARVLSSEKGFEQFIKISKRLLENNKNLYFVVLGGENGPRYGYEPQYLENKFKEKKTFKEYVLEGSGVDLSNFTFLDTMNYDDFAKTVEEIDLFLYPLQFGSANWGLFELLLRGKIVIASNKCFIPEVIKNGENGYLCDYDDLKDWEEKTMDIINNPEKHQKIGEQAKKRGEEFAIAKIAPKYLEIFENTINKFNS